MNTPRDYNQQPWPPGQNPRPDPAPGSGAPQQGGIPWYQQPVVRAAPPQQRPPTQYPAPGRQPSPYPVPGQHPPAQQYPPARQAGPGRYGSPGQWGQPAPAPTPATNTKPSSSKRKPLLIGAAIVAVLIVGVIAVSLLSGVVNGDNKKVAVTGVQTEVQQILQDRVSGYDADDIKGVKCNNGQDPVVKKGKSFTCDVSVRGKRRQLTVTWRDDDGTYEVGLPQLEGGK